MAGDVICAYCGAYNNNHYSWCPILYKVNTWNYIIDNYDKLDKIIELLQIQNEILAKMYEKLLRK